MDFGRAFSYVTEDTDWLKKIIIGAVMVIIPIVGPLALAGWALEILRRVIKDETQLLPEWDQFGTYIVNGLKELVIGIVYFLPALLIYGCAFATIFGGSAISASADSGSADMIGSAITILTMCMYCVLFLFIIIGALLIAPAIGSFAESGELASAFRVGEVFDLLRAAIGPYLLSLLIVGLVGSIATSLGSIACGVGALFAAAYVRAVASHLYGQAYKSAKSAQSEAPM